MGLTLTIVLSISVRWSAVNEQRIIYAIVSVCSGSGSHHTLGKMQMFCQLGVFTSHPNFVSISENPTSVWLQSKLFLRLRLKNSCCNLYRGYTIYDTYMHGAAYFNRIYQMWPRVTRVYQDSVLWYLLAVYVARCRMCEKTQMTIYQQIGLKIKSCHICVSAVVGLALAVEFI